MAVKKDDDDDLAREQALMEETERLIELMKSITTSSQPQSPADGLKTYLPMVAFLLDLELQAFAIAQELAGAGADPARVMEVARLVSRHLRARLGVPPVGDDADPQVTM